MVGLMRESLIHALRVKIPDRRPAHDINSKRTYDCEIYGSVRLLHEARLLRPALQSTTLRQRAQELLHYELPGKGEHHDIEEHKSNIPQSFAIFHERPLGRIGRKRYRVREEYEMMERIRWGRVDSIEAQENDYESQRCNPGMFEGVSLVPLEQATRLPTFRERLLAVSLILCLLPVNTLLASAESHTTDLD